MPRYKWDISDLLFEEDVRKMFDYASNGKDIYGMRSLALFWLTGARTTEAVMLVKENFAADEKMMSITIPTLKLGNSKDFKVKDRTLQFERTSGLQTNIYIEYIIQQLERVQPNEKFLPYTARWVEWKIGELSQKALNKSLCPYHFRHSVMTWKARKGATIDELMYWKGARSLSSVAPYIHAKPSVVKLEALRRERVSTNAPVEQAMQPTPQPRAEATKEKIEPKHIPEPETIHSEEGACEFCGKNVKGKRTNPFAEEINNDTSLHFICEACANERANEV